MFARRITPIFLISGALALGACKSETKKPAEKPAEKPVEKPAEKPVEKPAEKPAAVAGAGGSIKGVVSFEGTPPKPEKVDMKKDPKCMKSNKDAVRSDAKVKDGKIAEVFVHIKSGLTEQKWDVREDEVVLDQVGCLYHPRVIGLQEKQKLTIVNSDPLLHNVHAMAKRGEFNMAMPTQGMKLEKTFKKGELGFEIKCDVHAWMKAWGYVVEHPYFATTAEDGSFEIKGVPAGKYTVEFLHPTLGAQTAEVTVTDGDATAAATFKAS